MSDETFTIRYSNAATKHLAKIPKKEQSRIKASIESLAREPRPPGSIKMQGYGETYRIREGDYRILYTIYRQELQIDVIDIDHRKDIYRNS